MFTVRTIDEIFQQLLLEKQSLTSLNGLSANGITNEDTLIPVLDNGQAPEWVLWLYNMAVQIHLTEVRTLSAVDDIDLIFETKRVATGRWYIEKSLEFQVDDTLIIDPFTYQVKYDPIDTDAQIIGSCTIKTFSNKLFLKVRRIDTDILSANELVQFTTYINELKIAGTQAIVENFPGDELTLNMTIIYDGTKSLTDVTTLVEGVVNDYIVNLEFDSKFITSALIDNLQQLDEVLDPRFDGGVALDSLSVEVAFLHEYTTNAGWGIINPLTPLSGTISYIPRTK